MNNTQDLYRSYAWKKLSHKVRRQAKGECQRCRGMGRYTPAVLVHHELDVDDYPEHALDEFFIDDEGNINRNLIPLCFDCHEKIETERGNRGSDPKPPLTKEWW